MPLPDHAYQGEPLNSLGQVSASELKARGWTETMIRRLLGAPCSTARNPRFPSAAPVRLYSLERVTAARASVEFPAAARRAAIASRRALKVHREKAQALVAIAWAIDITVPRIGERELRAAAEECLRGEFAGQSSLPIGLEHLLAGYAVEILLERSEPNLIPLDEAFSASGVRLARAVVRKRILAEIGTSYAWLRDECARRFRAERGNVSISEDDRALELA